MNGTHNVDEETRQGIQMTLSKEETEFIYKRRNLLEQFKRYCNSPIPTDEYHQEADARLMRQWEVRLRTVGIEV